MLYLVTNHALILANSSDFMSLVSYEDGYGEENDYYFLASAKNDNDLAEQITNYCKLECQETNLAEELTWYCYPMQETSFRLKVNTRTIVTYNGTRVHD